MKCDYCGRFNNTVTCVGCGAPVIVGPAIMYNSQVFNNDMVVQLLARPGQNIPVSTGYGRGLSDVLEIQRRFNR